jgi:HK97 gp10 family phage protein
LAGIVLEGAAGMTLGEFAARLRALDLEPVQRAALAAAAQRIVDDLRAALSTQPGGDHAAPWLGRGALRDSIATESDATGAVIGSTSDVAVYQELGTRRDPPRPFLAPAAAAQAETVAEAIGAAVADALAALR